MPPRTSVVMITRDRRQRVLDTLPRLTALPDVAEVIVVDDASTDGTAAAVALSDERATVVRLHESMGAAARNVGVERATTPYVAFADDDSWWYPGSLAMAAAVFDATPEVALVAGRVLVGPGAREDPTNHSMAASPLPARGLPGPEVLGFVACGAVVRRSAFLAVGGFEPRLHIGGEEELLALDLRTAGWRSVYVEDVVAHHAPDSGDPRPRRRRQLARNAVWSAWLRRPWPSAVRATGRVARVALGDRAVAAGLIESLGGWSWVRRDRRPIGAALERDRRLVERARGGGRRPAMDGADAAAPGP